MTDSKLEELVSEQGISVAEYENETSRMLTYLEMDKETAVVRRREMRAKLLHGRGARKPPQGTMTLLHRSESSRRLFVVAARKAQERGEVELRPMHILESLFEMNLVSLESL